jgi:curli biogenesis system outer membrane secretion channel CsgG
MCGWRLVATVAGAGWLLLWCGSACGQEVAAKRRVAVLNFDNPSVGTDAPSGLFGADGEDVGKGVSVQLIQKLVQGGKYTVVDRSALEKLLKEQKDANSGADAHGLAAAVGRLLGLDAMIIGAITRFGPDDKGKSGSGGLLHSGVRTRQSKAYVEITARVFNVSSGEVIAGFTGAGESAHSGTVSTLPTRGQSKSAMDVLGSEFVESLLGEATRNAVEQIATQLNLFAEKIPALRLALEGLVAEVEGNILTLNIGKKAGVNVGEHLEIVRNAGAAGDSTNADTLQRAKQRVGLATVTEVADDYSIATFSGSAHAQVGDCVLGGSQSKMSKTKCIP